MIARPPYYNASEPYSVLTVSGKQAVTVDAPKKKRSPKASTPPKDKFIKDFLREQRVSLFRIRQHPRIAECRVDRDGTVIIKTKKIFVESYYMGVYEIFIDFFYTKRVRILNTSKVMNTSSPSYDGPHIRNTVPCFGNLEADIYQEIKDKKLYMIVADCIDFLQSGSSGQPYITAKQFHKFATSNRNFSFNEFFKLFPDLRRPPQNNFSLNSQYLQYTQYNAIPQPLQPPPQYQRSLSSIQTTDPPSYRVINRRTNNSFFMRFNRWFVRFLPKLLLTRF